MFRRPPKSPLFPSPTLSRPPDRRVRGVDALPAGAAGAVDIYLQVAGVDVDLDVLGLRQHRHRRGRGVDTTLARSEEHTSELQSRQYLVCRLLLEKKTSTS